MMLTFDDVQFDLMRLAWGALERDEDAIILKDIQGNILSWNAGATQVFGFQKFEMLGESIRRLMPTDLEHEADHLLKRLSRGEKIRDHRTTRLTSGGGRISVSLNLLPITNTLGKVVGVLKVARRLARGDAPPYTPSPYQQVFQKAPAMVLSINSQGVIVSVSDRWLEALGYTRDQVIGKPCTDFLTEESRRQAVNDDLPFLFAYGSVRGVERRFVRSDGSCIDTVLSAESIVDGNGLLVQTIAVLTDITSLKELNRSLHNQNELLRVTLDSIRDGVVTTDARGQIAWINPAAEALTGWELDDARGKPAVDVLPFICETSHAAAGSPFERAMATHQSIAFAESTALLCKDGSIRGVEGTAAPIHDDAGAVIGAVMVLHDLSEKRRMNSEVIYRATRDALTGTFNRAEFETRLHRTFIDAKALGNHHSVMFIDLDQFKLVNDACGHMAGDELLKDVARLFSGNIRSTDTLARIGGDEFAILMEDCPVNQARRVAQAICDQLEGYRFIHDGHRFRIGASIGLVPLDSRWTDGEALMQAADAACYAAKESGQNRVYEWNDTDQVLNSRHHDMAWANRIIDALDQDAFRLYAQRIEPFGDTGGPAVCYEILLRMTGPDGEIVVPGQFIPAAERFHQITRIDRWVVKGTVKWLLAHGHLVDLLTANISGISLVDKQFQEFVLQQIDALQDDAPKLCIEITETAAIGSLSHCGDFLGQVRARGARVALDDFGAGSSFFDYLRHLPVDLLKIDGQFVTHLRSDPMSRAAVCCFRDVARICNIQTIAEYVESAEVMEELRAIGIDYAQGYHIHRPEPLDSIERQLATVGASARTGDAR